jgi:protein-S-isoprenylcysteine O-methyltransferase Ste14
MTLTPAFELGVWNAWIFIVPLILAVFGLTPFLFRSRKSTFWAFPSYTRLERMYLLLFYVIFGGLLICSVFLPLAIGTVWFYIGLFVYLLGFAFLVLGMLTFVATPVDKPNTTGIYRISRHPWYVGMFFIFFGTGVASASWVYLLLALILLAPIRNCLMIPEERECCERFGNAYREYMDKTPIWIGIPK